MGSIRCKFTCVSVTKFVSWNRDGRYLYRAEFQAVTDGSEENKKFFEATPSGKIELATYREDHFEPGQTYYIDFTPA